METTEQLAIDASIDEDDESRSPNSNESSNSKATPNNGFSWPFGNIIHNGKNDVSSKTSPEKFTEGRRPIRKAKTATSPVPKGLTPSSTGTPGYTNSRYSHDVEQAILMRKGMERRKQQHSRKEVTETEVQLGLEGLDQAQNLRHQGRIREALDISELSIELLIQFLKSDPGTSTSSKVDRNMVGLRIQTALTAAEEMKSSLSTSPSSDSGNNQPSSITVQKSGQSLTQSLTEAIQKSANEAVNATRQYQSKKQQPRTRHTAASSKNVIPNKRTTMTNHPTTYTPKVVSPLANSRDPLVQTIKSDLYIDPSQLQSTTWKDIAGLEDAKDALQESAILPLMRPDLFSGLRRPRNILLYGPPGTGKTMLVKAVAYESQCVLFVCTASALTSKWHGEGEKLLRTLFEVARAAAPSIIFVDEMDALLSSRKSDGEHEASRRFKTEFMTQMDGIVKHGGSNEDGKHLLVIAATNCPWDIDSAVLRRFPRRIYVPLPDPITRTALLQKLLEKAGDHQLAKADIAAIVKRLNGFSGSDIASIASEASFGPIRSLGGIDAIRGAKSADIRPIQRQDFDIAIDQATKSVSKKLLKLYDEWKKEQAAS